MQKRECRKALPLLHCAGELFLGGGLVVCDRFGCVMSFDGAFVREARLLVGAKVVIHAVRSSCSFVGMGCETMNLGGVYVVCHGHSCFLL
jgi:hypothetical protein